MNQTILFLRSAQVYDNKELALAGIAGVSHKAGQPVVAFYYDTVDSAKVTKLAFAIGNGEGTGNYNLLTTESEYDELVKLLELHVDNFDTHISKVANGTLGHVKNSDYITFDNTGAGKLVDNSVELDKLQKIAAKSILGNASDAEDNVAVLTAEEVFGLIAAEIANNFKTNVKSEDGGGVTVTTTIGEVERPGFSLIAGDNVTITNNEVDGALIGTNITISVDPTNFSVDKANEAAKLSTAREFSITGDDYINGTESPVSFDGTGNVDLAISLDKEALAAAILTNVKTDEEVKEEGKAIVSISQANGIVSASAGNIAAEYVDIKDENEYFTATTVEGALAELYSQAGAGSKVTMTSANVEEEDGEGNKVIVAKEYKFYQGGSEEANLIGSINIAKDLVVNKGELVEKDGEQYIVLELNDINKTKIEVKVTDLVDTYTGSGAITIDESNVISFATANYFTQDNNKLELSLGTSLEITADKKINVNYKSGSGLYEVVNEGLAIKIKDDEDYITTDTNGLQTTQALQDALDAWKDITVNGNSFDTSEGLGSANITLSAEDITYGEGSNVRDALNTLSGNVGKIYQNEDSSDLKYISDVLKTGTAVLSENIYSVNVECGASDNYFTVKIDTIDGGTF